MVQIKTAQRPRTPATPLAPGRGAARTVGALSLLAGLLAFAGPALAVSGLTFTRITPFATLDSNNSCAAGPNSLYIQVNVTNASGAALTNLTATFDGFTQPNWGLVPGWSTTPVAQFQLDAEESAVRSIPSIANGETVRLYWFVNYPCWSGGGAPPAMTGTYTVTVSDGVTAPQTSAALDLTTRSELSAAAGGQMVSQDVGAGAALGQIVPVTVVYDFGNVGSGNDLGMQPAGNLTHNSGCYRLVGSDVTSVVGLTGITTSDDNTLYKTGVSSGGGTNTITIVYYFKAVGTTCPSGTTVNPYSDMVSGAQQKYSDNFGTCSATPCVLTSPLPSNVLTLAKSVSPTSLPAGGTATYTVTIANPSAFATTLDSLTDTLPAGVTFDGIVTGLGGSDVVAGNSASLPTSGASGTIQFVAKDSSTCTLPPALGCTWVVPAGGSIVLKYTVNVPATVGVYSNSVAGKIGALQIDTTTPTGDNAPAVATILVGTPPTVAKSFSPNPITAGGTSILTITLTNPNASDLTGVSFTDTLPAMTVAGSPVPGQCGGTVTNTATSVTLTGGTIPGGSPGTCTVVLSVLAPFAGSYMNTIPAGDLTTASGLSNTVEAIATLVALAPPDLSLLKSDGGATTVPGGTVAWTLTYSNTGGQTATGVVLTETVPANSTFNAGASTAGWVCAPNNNAGSTCTLAVGSVAAPGSGSATFAVTVVSPLPAGVTQLSNTASIADDGTHGTDPTPGNNSGSDTTPVAAAPDLSVVKSGGSGSIPPGVTIPYSLAYANTGNQGATGVTLTEIVPANTTYSAFLSSPGWACVPNGNAGSTCTLAIGSLAAGASGTVAFAVTVASPIPAGVTQIANTATIADDGANGSDPNPANNTSTFTGSIVAMPNLVITKSDGGASVTPGGTVAWTLTYANAGNIGATGVVITETVPANTTFNAGASTAGWACAPNNNAGSTCTLAVGAVAGGGAGGSATFAATVVNPVPAGVTQVANTATIADDGTNGIDANPANNSGSDTTPITGAPDLTLTKSDGGVSVAPGGTVAWTLTYANAGNIGATGVVITETVPANTTFAAGSSTAGWACVPNNNAGSTCTLAIGSVAAAGGGTATFAVTVANPVPAGVTQISNTATIADDGTNGADANPGNNSGSDTTPITGAPDLTLTKSADVASVTPGGTVVWTLTYANVGNRNATGLVLTETVPSNTTFTAASSTAGWICAPSSAAGSTCTLAIGAVAAGAGGSATFAATVVSPVPGGVTEVANTASIADDGANGTDPNPANNSATATTPVTVSADLVSTVDAPPTATPGLTVVVQIGFQNLGPDTAVNARPTAQLPPGLSGVVVSNGGTYDPLTGVVTWPTLPTFASGASLSYTVSFIAPAQSPVSITANITSDTPDPVTQNNPSSDLLTIAGTTDIPTASAAGLALLAALLALGALRVLGGRTPLA